MSASSQEPALVRPAVFLQPEIADQEKTPAVITRRLRTLWESRHFLSRAMLAGLLAGTLSAFLIPKRFESQTRLMPPDQQSSSGMGMAAMLISGSTPLAPMAGNLLGIKSSGDLFIGILQSRTVEDRIVDRFNLKGAFRTQLQQEARKQLEENTSISQDRKSGIITISVSDQDPRRAAAIAQAYVEELDRLVSDLSTSAAHREREFLEGRLQAVKQELDQASRDFSQFESANATLDIKEQGRAMFDAAATLTGQLVAAQSELKGLEAIYTPNNVRVQSVQARITELGRQLAKMSSTEPPAERPGAGDASYPSIRKLPLLGVTYMNLYRQTKIKEAVYETLTQQYELAKVQEAKEIPTVKVLDAAKIPEKKSFPPRLEIILLCTVLSLILASTAVLGRARWNEMDSAHPGKQLARDVFRTTRANLPWASSDNSHIQTGARNFWARASNRAFSRKQDNI